jgi:gamma-glutamyl hercynylcysteine S-oxide synthase
LPSFKKYRRERKNAMRAVVQKSVIYLALFGVIVVAVSLGAAIIIFGPKLNKSIAIGTISIGLVYIVTLITLGRNRSEKHHIALKEHIASHDALQNPRDIDRQMPAFDKPIEPGDIEGLVEQMLAQDRFALLLRPKIATNLSETNFGRALSALGEYMALVPDGQVQLEHSGTSHSVTVQRFFLDRYPVTNKQYYEFVAAGGYKQPALWDESILPGVLEFIDCTGHPGPRYWQKGCYPLGEEKHPVVGVSWYEAAAYARWVGKRLPNDAEWVKAGAWPVRISSTTQVQRKYPWGDSMDRRRANLWGSGPGKTVPVDQYTNGISAGGVFQLIGNVWQWTSSNFNCASLPADQLPAAGLRLETVLRSIRGGAFDTYFDNQASCQFQSGENPLNRRNNIGFRCAVGVCDLALVRPIKKDLVGSAKDEG